MKRLVVGLAGLMLFFGGTRHARADFIGYNVTAGTVGNQNVGGMALGMDFNVNSPIVVTQLGVFDSGAAPLAHILTAQLYDRTTGLAVTPLVVFTPGSGSGTLVGGSLFLPIAPIALAAGFQGSIVTSLWDSAQPNYNTFGVPNSTATTDTGGGLISFVGGSRYSGGPPDVFPTFIDGGPANRYDAGTFAFHSATPEPGSLALLGIGAVGLGGYAWRRRRRHTAPVTA